LYLKGKTMRFLLPLILLAASANATLVDFTTSGVLSCGAAANCSVLANVLLFHTGALTQPTLTIAYVPNTEANLNASPSASTNFGTLSVLCLLCGPNSNASFNLAGALLGITISQGPDPFNQSSVAFSGTFNGSFNVAAGNLGGLGGISFGTLPIQTTFAAGSPSVSYQLQEPQPPPVLGYAISATNATTIQGIVSSDVPEPATLSLIGFGLVGLGMLKRKRVTT